MKAKSKDSSKSRADKRIINDSKAVTRRYQRTDYDRGGKDIGRPEGNIKLITYQFQGNGAT